MILGEDMSIKLHGTFILGIPLYNISLLGAFCRKLSLDIW
jgi:hypothetical protein